MSQQEKSQKEKEIDLFEKMERIRIKNEELKCYQPMKHYTIMKQHTIRPRKKVIRSSRNLILKAMVEAQNQNHHNIIYDSAMVEAQIQNHHNIIYDSPISWADCTYEYDD